MRGLARRLAWFALPLLLPALLFEAVLWRLGETWPVAKVAATMDGRDGLYGRRLVSQQFGRFKQLVIERRAPEILVLGSSRVHQLRAGAFAPLDAEFYNGGGLLQHLGDLGQTIDAMQSGALPTPQIAIVGVDPWWLKQTDAPIPTGWSATNRAADAALQWSEHRRVARALLRRQLAFSLAALRTGALGPSPFFGVSAIGAGALDGQGFRADGSYQYHPAALIADSRPPRYVDRERPPVIDRISATSHQFSPTAGLDPARVDTLIAALESLAARGVEVYAVLPPVADVCYEALERSAPLRAWWRGYVDTLPPRLEAAGIVTLPASSPRDWGVDDTAMIDGFHAGEVLSARLLLGLIERVPPGRRLAQIDVTRLRTTLAAADAPLFFDLPTPEVR